MTLFYKNIFTVLTGTGLAQLIPVLGSLIIVRIFSPATFGDYALWFSVTLILTVIISGRFETSIAVKRPGEERTAAIFYTLSTILIGFLIFSICTIPVYIYMQHYEHMDNAGLLLLTPIAAGFTAITQLIIAYYASEGLFRNLSIFRIVQSASLLLMQIFAGYFSDGSIYALTLTHIASLLVTILFSFLFQGLLLNFDSLKIVNVVTFWKQNNKYLLYSLPADTVNCVSAELPVILIMNKFGSEAAGVFALALRILGAPISLIAKAVLDVFKKHASDQFRDIGTCEIVFIKTLKLLTILAVLFFIFSYYLIEPLFQVAFGSEWIESGEIAKILILLFSLRFIASPLSYVVYITGKQQIDLYWQIALFLVTTLSFVLIVDFKKSILIYNYGYSLLYVIYIYLCYKMTVKQ